MEHDLTMLAGCTTVYLENFGFESVPSRQSRPTPAPRVEQTLERVLARLENDLRVANIGMAWSPPR
ncbi:MAG: hypothetical protein ACREBC_27760 [Pyrinomonadaceae bacterium]